MIRALGLSAALALSACADPRDIGAAGERFDDALMSYTETKAATLKLLRDRAYYLMERYKTALEGERALRLSPLAGPEEWRRLMGEIEGLEGRARD